MAEKTYDGVKSIIAEFSNHNGVESCQLVREQRDKFTYLVSFSEKHDRRGIGELVNNFRGKLQKIGYDANTVLSVYDSTTVDEIREFEKLSNNHRVFILEF